MAWNPSPKVAAARDYAQKFDKAMVLIIGFSPEGIEVVSFGKNKPLCEEAKKYGDRIVDCLEQE